MSAFDDYLKTKPEHWRGGYTESALEDCWNAAIKSVEVAPSASTNTGSPKLPTLEEVQMEVQSQVWGGGFKGTSSSITEIVYNYICRQLRAGA